jgi:hypothetical protein
MAKTGKQTRCSTFSGVSLKDDSQSLSMGPRGVRPRFWSPGLATHAAHPGTPDSMSRHPCLCNILLLYPIDVYRETLCRFSSRKAGCTYAIFLPIPNQAAQVGPWRFPAKSVPSVWGIDQLEVLGCSVFVFCQSDPFARSTLRAKQL